MIRGFFYRVAMKIAHRFNWHYAPPIYPDGDVQLWCKWCGFRQTIQRGEPLVPQAHAHQERICGVWRDNPDTDKQEQP